MPLITVILPVYNIKGEYLTKAVGSVLAQSFDDFELLIVDDGSRRETAAVCDELAAPHFGTEAIDLDDAFRDKMANVFFAPWAKLVKMEIIKRHNLAFAEDGNRFDDVLFHIFLNEYAARFSFVDEVLYHHRLFANSITGSSSQNTDMYFDVFKTIESAAAKCAADGISVKRIIDRNMNFFCSANDIIKSRKEFIGKMRSYIKKFGLKDVLRKQRNRKIRHWLFTADKKNGVLRVLGIYLMNGRKKS